MATRIRVIHDTAVFAIIWRNLSAPTAPPRTMDARRARTRGANGEEDSRDASAESDDARGSSDDLGWGDGRR